MARNYAAVPWSYRREMALLTDEEFGRLIRSLLAWSEDGAEFVCTGNERFYVFRVQDQERRFQENYEERVEQNRANGRKGGRPRKQAEQPAGAADAGEAAEAPEVQGAPAASDPAEQTGAAESDAAGDAGAPAEALPETGLIMAGKNPPVFPESEKTETETETEIKTETETHTQTEIKTEAPLRGALQAPAAPAAGVCVRRDGTGEVCSSARSVTRAAAEAHVSASPLPSAGPVVKGEVCSSARAAAGPTDSAAAEPEGFARFWAVWPKHTGKKAAQAAWEALAPDAALTERILQAVQAQCSWPQWQREAGRYIPDPARWLARGSWEDELPALPAGAAETGRAEAAAAWNGRPGAHEFAAVQRLVREGRRRAELQSSSPPEGS